MKKILYAVLIIVFAVGAAFINLSEHTDKPEPVIAPNPPIENLQVEVKVYKKSASIMVYPSASPQILGEVNDIKTGARLKILGKENDFYHVQYELGGEMKEGYIPTWYLDDDKATANNCDYDYQVLKEAAKGLLYPGGPEIVDLEQGKLLRPFMESDQWFQVSIIAYDIPAVLTAWIKKDKLVSPEELQAKDGFIPSDAELYFANEFKDIKNTKPQKEAYPKSVYIKKRENGYAYVGAAGGWTAWVEEKWIRYTNKDLK